ncbi:MAG: Gldg family protein [Clostridia bacterium]|nr:Gldg family protein [Clostridia bacterium]
MKRKNWTVIFICLAVLIALLFNLGIALIPARFRWVDVTKNRTYTLSSETKEYLSAIDEPVTLYLLNSDGSDAQFEYYLERFCQYSSALTLHKADASDCGALLERTGVSAENISPYTLILDGEKRTAILNYSDLFYYVTEHPALNQMGIHEMTSGEYYYYAQLFSQNQQYAEYLSFLMNDSHLYFEGESALLSMLEYVRTELIPTHYVLTGHGERDLSNTLFAQLAIRFGGGYQILDLTEVSQIPADAASVLLFAPSEDYNEEQIEALCTYMDGGGLLTVVTGREQLALPNLTELLASYGLSADATTVKEEVTVLDDSEQSEPTKEISDVVDVFINTDHNAMATLDLEDAAPAIKGGNAICFDGTMDQKPLLTTSSQAMLGENPATKGEKVLAATVENSDGAKLVWFTGAESFCASSSEMTEDTSGLYNAYCLYLVRDWTNLVYESTVSLSEATVYDASYLQMTSGGAIFLMVVGIIVIPVGIAVTGILIRYRRKKA